MPEIETERLLLREPRLDDDLTEFVHDHDVQRWLGVVDTDPRVMIERWVRRWERNGLGWFVVECEGRFVGRVGFAVWDSSTWRISGFEEAGDAAEVELGWAILSSHWGHGYATEAATAARAWAGRARLVSLVNPANERSQRVAQKLGAAPTERVETEDGTADVWLHP